MAALEQVKTDTNWQQAANTVNNNFQKVNTDLEKVKLSTTHSKGYFSTDAELKSAIQTAVKGDIAYVGTNYPYQIWKWNGSAWKNTGQTGGAESVALTDYYTKSEIDIQQSEQNDTIDKSLMEYNVSKFHPTGGIDGTNKYTLETAIAQVPSKYRSIGIKCSFINSAGKSESWEYQGSSWIVSNFKKVGAGAIDEVSNKQGIYNVDANKPLSSGQFYTASTARAAVPSSVRKLGLIITYKTDATTSVTEQYIGSAVSAWTTEANWKNVGSEGGNKILVWNTDAATTRKQVPSKERKKLLQISYENADGQLVNEQYVGTSFTDTEWAKDSNWKQLNELLSQASEIIAPQEPYQKIRGFLKTNGTIDSRTTTYYIKKFNVESLTEVWITLVGGISFYGGWAAFWTVNSEGNMIKSYSIDELGNKFYDYYLQITEDIKEVWITASPVNELGIKSSLGKTFASFPKIVDDETDNIFNIADEYGNIIAYIDVNGKLVTKDSLKPVTPLPNVNNWKGKIWYAYGTSITSILQGKYVDFLAQFSEMEVVNKGIPGGGITDLGGYAKGQVKNAIMNITDGKTSADLITLEVGANEGGELGTKFDIGDDTFCGCLNQCIRYLQENTNAQIVIMPSVSTTTEPSEAEGYYNRLAIIKDVCEINRVYYIDGNCGLGWARIKGADKKYTSDNIHQTELGGYILAEYMWSILQHIPTWKSNLIS